MLLIHVRAEARRLARQLRRSMLTEHESWEIDADRQGRPVLSRGRFRIAIVPRNVRLFDAIHLFCDEVEVWLPLVARIRLRNAARYIIVRLARDEWATPSAEQCPIPLGATEEQPV
jgi:hypothetical protein